MRAYQLPKGGAGIEALVGVDWPDPKPAYRQMLVKVAACSLSFRDFGIVRGTFYGISVQMLCAYGRVPWTFTERSGNSFRTTITTNVCC